MSFPQARIPPDSSSLVKQPLKAQRSRRSHEIAVAVRDEVMHVDFLEVNLSEKIRASVAIELEGGDDAPGVKEGGVLDHATREVEIEAETEVVGEEGEAAEGEAEGGDSDSGSDDSGGGE